MRRGTLPGEIDRLEAESAARNALHLVTREQLRELVRTVAVEIDETERSRLKGVLQAAVEQIMLDPGSLNCRIRYRIVAGRTLDMASPTGLLRTSMCSALRAALRAFNLAPGKIVEPCRLVSCR